jgi:hypothetical protein
MASCAAPGCTRNLPPRAAAGRERAYCSDTCRARANRVVKHFQLADDVASLVRSSSDHGLLAALAALPATSLVMMQDTLSESFQGHSYAAGVTKLDDRR